MDVDFVRRRGSVLAVLEQARWPLVLLFLLAGRLLLTGLALAATNLLPFNQSLYEQNLVVLDPQSLPGVWLRFDAGYYVDIARQSYASFGKDTNFLPLYPLFVNVLAGGSRLVEPNASAGMWISNVAFLFSGLLFWQLTRDTLGARAAWAALASLVVFPTSFFFSAIYTESLFLFFSLLVWWFARKRQYEVAALAVVLASLTRVTGLLLVIIPLVELLERKPARMIWRFLATGAIASLGLLVLLAFNWALHDNPLAFMNAQSATMGRSITPPWTTVIDSLRAIAGEGEYRTNYFSRLSTLHDLAYLLFFTGLGGLAFLWLPRSLSGYMAAVLLLHYCSHGPSLLGVYSVSRYVVVIFPGFMVMGLLLERGGRWRWLAYGAMAAGLIVLTAWWVTGRWVA
jgi:hypothetical protein